MLLGLKALNNLGENLIKSEYNDSNDSADHDEIDDIHHSDIDDIHHDDIVMTFIT